MKNILFVGENPLSNTGNAHMMRELLERIDTDKYNIACFGAIDVPPWNLNIFHPLPFTFISAAEGMDHWGNNKLCTLIERTPDLQAVVFVGIDVWRYSPAMQRIKDAQRKRGFRWISLFPYDLHFLRSDYVKWINMFDVPCVYSQYGYELLKDHVPELRYFRPPLHGAEHFKRYIDEDREHVRRTNFPTVPHDCFLFGFVGANQIRKDPTKLLQAFAMVKEQADSKVSLYMHTELKGGIYNLYQYMKDLGMTTGEIIVKHQGGTYKTEKMGNVYNSFDCLVNCSMQEGLSWTIVEGLLSGVPIIASDTTAHPELVKDVGFLVPCSVPSLVPMYAEGGESWIDSRACKAEDLAGAMLSMIQLDKEKRETLKRLSLKKGKEWLDGVNDIGELLDEVTTKKAVHAVAAKKSKVLFAQHSAAGDVFMTTRCFKGVRERYKMPLDYMTSPQYMDIVKGNPYLEEIIPWEEAVQYDYTVVVNPHGDKILPGHWGRNCNSILSDFYWKILEVEPDDFFIEREVPDMDEVREMEKAAKLFVVQTTGGDPAFRTYKYMADVCAVLRGMGYTTVQLGGPSDFPAGSDFDMRGKLSYRAGAWVMDQAVGAVTIDSFISHLAGAVGVSQVCLFGSGNAVVTRPNQLKGKLVCLSPDYVRDCQGLGPCSAGVRDCPAPCTGAHDPNTIINEIIQMKEEGWIRRANEHTTASYILKHAQ